MEDQPSDLGGTTPTPNTTPEPTIPESSAEGGIFSSSDTRIETENLPEVPEVVQQAPASSISPTLRTTSTVTSDLKLGGSTTKKKKWPFVLLGVAAVAVIAISIWFIVGKMGDGQQDAGGLATPVVTAELKNAYNSYVNLLFFGKNTEESLISDTVIDGTFETNGIYAEEMINSTLEERETYLNALNNTFLTFKKVYEECHFVTPLNDIPDYFYRYATRNEYLLSELISLYLEKGQEGTLTEVNARFTLDTDNAALADYLENQKRATEIEVSLIGVANQVGCIKSGALDETCMAIHQGSFSEIDQSRLPEYMVDAFDAVTELRTNAVTKVYEIYDTIFANEIEKPGASVQ